MYQYHKEVEGYITFKEIPNKEIFEKYKIKKTNKKTYFNFQIYEIGEWNEEIHKELFGYGVKKVYSDGEDMFTY